MNEPGRADLLLRAMRQRVFSNGEPIDELTTIRAAGSDVGISPDTLDGWLADERVDESLHEDMAAARAPLPEALALGHRLSRNNGGLRYSTASALFERDNRRVVMAGFQPFAVYEVAVANVAPDLDRTPAPHSSEEILGWAPYPLATAEVAELRGIDLDRARQELERCGRPVTTAGGDYWSAGDGPS